MEEYLLIQERSGGKKTILATYTAKEKTIGQETAEGFNTIPDGCHYYLQERATQ